MPGIPEIDFGPFLNGDAAARSRVADEIRAACSEFGFLNVTNLPLPTGLVERVSAKAREFFALPREVKEAIGRSDLDVISGYVGVAVEHLDTEQPGDLKESFSLNQASLKLLDHWHIPVAGFRQTVLDLHEAGARACAALVQAMALSVGGAGGLLRGQARASRQHRAFSSTTRRWSVNPAQASCVPERIPTTATVTLVFQDSVEGLEALVDGGWLTVPVVPGAVTVNVADLLSRWTNGIYRSATHRVALPGADVMQSGTPRSSSTIPTARSRSAAWTRVATPTVPGSIRPSWPGNSSGAAVPPSMNEPEGRPQRPGGASAGKFENRPLQPVRYRQQGIRRLQEFPVRGAMLRSRKLRSTGATVTLGS